MFEIKRSFNLCLKRRNCNGEGNRYNREKSRRREEDKKTRKKNQNWCYEKIS